jgi:hypothetical protein
MTPREASLRDRIAKRAGVDRELFTVKLAHVEGRLFQVELYIAEGAGDEIRNRINAAMRQPLERPPKIKLTIFLLFLSLFASSALMMHSWWCLGWLLLAYLTMPRFCYDCGEYH